jgi:hypothetical protein
MAFWASRFTVVRIMGIPVGPDRDALLLAIGAVLSAGAEARE